MRFFRLAALFAALFAAADECPPPNFDSARDVDLAAYISAPWFDMYLRDRAPLLLNYNPQLTFQDEALSVIARKAIDRKTGARGLRSIVEGLLLDTMFDIPTETDIAEVVVDKDVVEGRKDPVRVLKGKEEAA